MAETQAPKSPSNFLKKLPLLLGAFLVMVSIIGCRSVNPRSPEPVISTAVGADEARQVIYQLELSNRLQEPLKKSGWSGEVCFLFQAHPSRPDPRRGPLQPLRPTIRVFQQACPFGQDSLTSLWQSDPYQILRADRLIYAGRPELRGEVYDERGQAIGRIDIDGRQFLSLCSDDFGHHCQLQAGHEGMFKLESASQVGTNP